MLVRNCQFKIYSLPSFKVVTGTPELIGNAGLSLLLLVLFLLFPAQCGVSVSPRQWAETVDSSRPPRQDSSTACFCVMCTLFLLSSSLCEKKVIFCFIYRIRASVFLVNPTQGHRRNANTVFGQTT